MQPTLSISVGSTISTILTADDLAYRGVQGDMDGWPFWSGDYLCAPCKFIYVWGTQSGATFRLSWSGATTPLTFWIGDVYDGPSIVRRGEGTVGERTVTVPNECRLNRFDTLMVGVDQKTDPGQTLS